jgi:hypothetical protein
VGKALTVAVRYACFAGDASFTPLADNRLGVDNRAAIPGGEDTVGNLVRCETCQREFPVRSFEWDVPVDVIICDEGIRVVGIDHVWVPQRLIVDYGQLDGVALSRTGSETGWDRR